MGIGRDRLDPTESHMTKFRAVELGRCYKSYSYFVNKYVKIYDSVEAQWIDFLLWPEQRELLHTIHGEKLVVILKARQLGISWLALSYALWTVIFRPVAAVSLFSRRDTEAMYLMGNDRLKGMYNALPKWMVAGTEAVSDNRHEWILGNGSSIRAFPTSAGDSYVSTLAIVDEADLSPDLNVLMRSVKPTIDNGGKMVLLSRTNKSEPESEFKNTYRGAREGTNGWKAVFLPWMVHPARSSEWYELQRRDILSRTGSLDDLYEQYPATDEEALSDRTLNKRIPPLWLNLCFGEIKELPKIKGRPAIPSLNIYQAPQTGVRYVIGADPAEGNEESDDSAATVLNVDTGEEVASFAGKHEPAVFASYISLLSAFFNFASVMVERNNHGHSVIQWMEEHARRVKLLLGHDSDAHRKFKRRGKRRKDNEKAGWLSTKLGNSLLYNSCTDYFRINAGVDEEGSSSVKVLHTVSTYRQLLSIELHSLSAPTGQHDDYADSFALAIMGMKQLGSPVGSGALAMDSAKGWGL